MSRNDVELTTLEYDITIGHSLDMESIIYIVLIGAIVAVDLGIGAKIIINHRNKKINRWFDSSDLETPSEFEFVEDSPYDDLYLASTEVKGFLIIDSISLENLYSKIYPESGELSENRALIESVVKYIEKNPGAKEFSIRIEREKPKRDYYAVKFELINGIEVIIVTLSKNLDVFREHASIMVNNFNNQYLDTVKFQRKIQPDEIYKFFNQKNLFSHLKSRLKKRQLSTII